MNRRILKLTLEYDGTSYVGWQRQAEGVSIQGLLEDALAPFEGVPVTVHGAGRTDAGVHALGQVASVSMAAPHDAGTLQRALNAVLPPDVRVLSVEEAPAGFHARFDAVSKIYEYRIATGPFVSALEYRYVWHVPGALDVEAMRAGARMLVGTHDFSAFQSSGGEAGSAERTMLSIAIECVRSGLLIRVEGNGFLRHMVRTIAGTLVDVGLGRWPASRVGDILSGRDRRQAGRAAPAGGLFLISVQY
jgi:tRNA pseudouridine38-40 synthase